MNEISKQENLVNFIEDNLELKKKRLKCAKNFTKRDKELRNFLVSFPIIGNPILLIGVTLFDRLTMPLSHVSYSFLESINYMLFHNPFTVIPWIVAMGLITGVMLISGVITHKNYKVWQREVLSNETQISFLEKKKEEETQKLVRLKNENKPLTEDNEYTKTTIDISKIENLQKRLDIYDYLITVKGSLENYLKNGSVPKELEDSGFSQDDIERIRDTDKEKVLSLNKRQNM